jgi:hypothetical protein
MILNSMRVMAAIFKATTVAALLAGAAAVQLAAQAPSGPTNLPAPPDVVRLPNRPAPEKAPLPPEEIVRRVGQYDDALAIALGSFTYRRTTRLEEFGPDGKASGRSEAITEMTVESDGSRRARGVARKESSLKFTELEPDVLEILAQIPVVPFTSAQLAKYDLSYQTNEAVDDLMTYVFRVTPRQVSRTAAYFSGVIWVDDRDLAVVKTYGKWVTETGDVTFGELPFNFFETYRQYVANKFWMPAYTRSDGFLTKNGARVPIRLTIRWEEFKQIPGSSLPDLPTAMTAPAAASSPSAPSGAPAPAAQPPVDENRPTLAPRQGR